MTEVVHRHAMPEVTGVRAGDVIALGAMRLLIVNEVPGVHTMGYGPVDMYAVHLEDETPASPGTIINSPWGMIEIVAVDHAEARARAAGYRARGLPLRTAEPLAIATDEIDDSEDEA